MDVKKILFISNTSWYIYNFRLGLMNILKKKSFEVIFCAPYDDYTKKLEKKGFRFIPINIDRKGKNPFKDLKLIWNLFRIYKKEKPHLALHFTIKPNIYGPIAAKLTNIKCLNTVTGLGYSFMKKNFFYGFVKILYKISFKITDRIFFQNNDDLKLFLENKIIDNTNKVVVVKGSGVNVGYFNLEFCKQIRKNDNTFVFILIGRLLWDKGIGEFVEAGKIIKKKYPAIEFQLLGPIDKGNPSGIPEERIKEWHKLGLIEYLGETTDVRPFICKSDCIVLPSYYREGIPRSLLEAMAMGKPIITADSVGCREVIGNDKNGFLVPVKNSKELADSMIKMIQIGEEKRKEMGKYGREKVLREFDERKVIDIYLKIIMEIVNNA